MAGIRCLLPTFLPFPLALVALGCMWWRPLLSLCLEFRYAEDPKSIWKRYYVGNVSIGSTVDDMIKFTEDKLMIKSFKCFSFSDRDTVPLSLVWVKRKERLS